MLPDQLQNWVSAQIDKLQAKYPPNRVAAVLLIALGAPAAALGGFLAVWVPKHFPGLPPFTPGQYAAFFLTGAGVVATAAVTQAYRFVDGVQRHEEQVRALAAEEAQNDHTQHIEAMRLESEERRVALASDNPHQALELLGTPDRPEPEAAFEAGTSGAPPAASPLPFDQFMQSAPPLPVPGGLIAATSDNLTAVRVDEGPEITPEPGPLPHRAEDEAV